MTRLMMARRDPRRDTAKGDVLRGTHLSVAKRPELSCLGDDDGPVEVRFGAIVDQNMRETFALWRIHGKWWIQL